MFGDLNGAQIAQNSFDTFKSVLDETIDVTPSTRAMLSEADTQKQLQSEIDAIKNKSVDFAQTPDSSLAFGKEYNYQPEKLSWTTKNYNVAELYEELSNGELYKKFDTYTPGIDNYEDHALKQGTGEKIVHGLWKAGDTAITSITGGTAGLIYGVGAWINQGKFAALYDNDFMKELDLHQERMRLDYANYKTKEEQAMSFGEKLGTANFWFDDAAQGIAFTAGALATEAIWAYATGGTSLATVGARWGLKVANIVAKIGKVADKTLDASRYLDDALRVGKVGKNAVVIPAANAIRDSLLKLNAANIGGRIGEGVNVFRGTFTGAGYESGFEARAFMNEARRDYKDQLGREPSAEEMAEFEDKLASTANGLYAYNLAIVGSSNAVQFGKLMNFKLPSTGISEAINKKIFGVGVEATETGARALKATAAQKGLQIGYSLGKGAFTEGFIEEGMQSVGTNTAMLMTKSGYDKELAKENYSTVEAFAKGLAQTYGTKEGLNEVFTGMVVGALTGNVMGMYQTKGLNLNHEFTKEINRSKLVEETFGQGMEYSSKVAIENMLMANRILASDKAEQNANRQGDMLGGQLARGGSLFAQFQRGQNLDYFDEQVDQLGKDIELIDVATLAKTQGISVEQAQEVKDSMKSELESEAKRFKKINEFTGYFVNNSITKQEYEEVAKAAEAKGVKIDKKQASDILRQALTYEMYMGELSYNHADEMLGAFHNEVQNTLGSTRIKSAFSIVDVLNKSNLATQRQAGQVKTELQETTDELAQIEKEFRNLENVAAKATTPEGRNATLGQLNDLTVKRDELTAKHAELTNQFNTLYNSAKLENPYGANNSEEFISADEILATEDRVRATLESIEKLKETNPEKSLRLETLLREYEKSVFAFKKYTERTNQMMSPKLGLKGRGNLLSKIVSTTEMTKEMIKGLLDTHFDKSKTQVDMINDSIKEFTNQRNQPKPAGVSMKPTTEQVDKLNMVDYINEQVRANPYLFEQMGGDFRESLPTDEELLEYIELYSPVLEDPAFDNKEFTYNAGSQLELFKKYLNDEEIARLVELNTKFANWQFLESIGSETVTIAELIQQEALSRKSVTEDTQDGVVTNDDMDTIIDASEKEVGDQRRFDVLQTVENVFIVDDKKGNYFISHMTPKKFFEEIGETGEITVHKKDKDGNPIGKAIKISVEEVNDYAEPYVTYSYGNTEMSLTKGMKIKVKKDGVNFVTRPTKSGYSMVFNTDGTPMKSDFVDVDSYSPNEIFKLKSGDELTLQVDMTSEFNSRLSEDEMLDNLHITLHDSNGNKVADLKANYGEDPDSEFLLIRKKAMEMVKASTEDVVTFGYVPVNTIFIGTPNLELTPEGSERQFDLVADRIKDYGYWDGQTLHIQGAKTGVRVDFLKGLEKNLPIIVVEEGNTLVAYPVTMNQVDKNLGDEIMAKGLSKGQLVLELNKELKANGLDTNLFYISDENTNMFQPDGKTSQELETAIDALNKVQDKADYIKGWKSKDDVVATATANINVDGIMFLSPKIAIDLKGFSEARGVAKTTAQMSQELTDYLSLRQELVKMGTIGSKSPMLLPNGQFKFEGATFNYFIDPENGNIISSGIANKNFKKLVDSYPNQTPDEKVSTLERLRKARTDKPNFFTNYNETLGKVAKMEADPILKMEYEDYVQQNLNKDVSDQNKKC